MNTLNEIISNSSAPFNREELFFTGTILPLLLSGNEFRDLKHLTDIMAPGLGLTPEYTAKKKNLLFYTEYNLKKSSYVTGRTSAMAEDLDGDTPDVLFYISDDKATYLFAIEVKMYHRPSFDNLVMQMQRQKQILSRMADAAAVLPEHIFHFALLPAKLAQNYPQTLPVITWENILDIYEAMSANAYAVDVLRYGLEQYGRLAAAQKSGSNNSTERLLGLDIVRCYKETGIKYVGCGGGYRGERFVRLATTTKWRYNTFQITTLAASPKRNWFSVDDFLRAVSWDLKTNDNWEK